MSVCAEIAKDQGRQLKESEHRGLSIRGINPITFDTRKFGQVIHDYLTGVDMVVDER